MKNIGMDIVRAIRASLDWLILLAFLLLLAPDAHSQTANGRVTAAAPAYVSGQTAPLSLDMAGNQRVNCASGCSGGTFNNNADGVATSATNGQTAAWLYNYNGATFDRTRGDTTAGLWVQLKAALPAGSAIIGNVRIDQTTPGTTNGVQINAGSAIIGNVRIDQTTPGTTNGVQVNAALPAGANIIGALTANQSVNVAQINGVTPLMGAGNTGTGSPRVTIATDQATVPTSMASQYPLGALPVTASATGTTAATTATLAANATKTTYICSMSIRSNATAAATGNATVTGTVTGTLNFNHWTAPVASGIGLTEMIFNPCIPGSTTNTGLAVISPAPGTGGVVSVTASGYQL